MPTSKREFLTGALTAAVAAGAGLLGGCTRAPDVQTRNRLPMLRERPLPAADDGHLLRMSRELERALAKPIEQRRWGMVIDLRRCVGCSACTINCAVENGLPPGVVYRPVIDEELGSYPNVARRFVPRPCMHCENPPCTPVCPVNATYARPDGIVEIDYDRCIGCRYCLTACPYNARTSDFGDFFTLGVGMEPDTLQPYERDAAYRDTLRLLASTTLGLLALDVLLEWAEFSINLYASIPAHADAFRLVIFGRYWWVFWLVHLGLGVLAPLLLLLPPRNRERRLVVALASGLIAVTFLAVRVNIVVPGLALPELEGLQHAYRDFRLHFDYFPNLMEWAVLGFSSCLVALLLFLGTRALPMLGEPGSTAEGRS